MRFVLLVLAMAVMGCQPRHTGSPLHSAKTGFRPSIHGFKFANGFHGSPLPRMFRESTSPIAQAVSQAAESRVDSRFGLCGGMSIAAADFYADRRSIPDACTAPEQGEPLYDYLDRRQLDSFGPGFAMAAKFLQWMALPDRADDGGADVESLTVPEVREIRERVERGELVVVGLVYVKAAGNARAPESPVGKPWENHQVLAYASRATPRGFDLLVYDPNFPGDDDVVLRFTPLERPSGDTWSISRVTGTGRRKAVRGVFAMPFVPAHPPSELGPIPR